MTPEERKAKQRRVKEIKRRRLGIVQDTDQKGKLELVRREPANPKPASKPRPKKYKTRKIKNKHLWITEPVSPLEKIRVKGQEVDVLQWLQMEAVRWGAGVEIKLVHDGKMVLARKRG